MKTAIKTTALFFAFTLLTSSCALFRGGNSGGGGHCPAYGSNMDANDENIEINSIQEIRKNSESM